MPIPWLGSFEEGFPSVREALAEPNGLLAAGGDLSSERLLDAYRHGIFPWFDDEQPILWWSPDPRLVLAPQSVRISRSLAKLMRQGKYRVTADQAFSEVIAHCAETTKTRHETWITEDMEHAYKQLHTLGYAHSIEVWSADVLVGGLYGIALGRVFFGESMFSIAPNSSKLALAALARQLEKWNYGLIDCQVTSSHLQSLGATEISREEFTTQLDTLIDKSHLQGPWQADAFTLEVGQTT